MEYFKKLLLWIVFLISIIGCIISISYLIVNAKEIPKKIILQKQVTQKQREPSKPSSGEGILKKYEFFMKKISIDLSAVTPIILVWFFASTAWYSGMFLFKKWTKWTIEKITNIEAFPFYRHYEITWIQLGFTGTLWGFLIIGWSMGLTDPETSIQEVDILKVLMRAFGTALLSTFTAVVMAYIITPIVKSFYRWAMEIPSVKELSAADEVTNQLRKLSQELEKSNRLVNTFNSKIENLTNKIPSIDEKHAAEIKANTERIKVNTEKNLTRQDEIIKTLKTLNEINQKLSTSIQEKNRAFYSSIQDMHEKLDRLVKRFFQIFKE